MLNLAPRLNTNLRIATHLIPNLAIQLIPNIATHLIPNLAIHLIPNLATHLIPNLAIHLLLNLATPEDKSSAHQRSLVLVSLVGPGSDTEAGQQEEQG